VLVGFPHFNEVFWAEDEGFEVVVVFLYACESGSDEGFSESDDIADEYAAAVVEVMCGDFDSGGLEFKEVVLKVAGDLEFG